MVPSGALEQPIPREEGILSLQGGSARGQVSPMWWSNPFTPICFKRHPAPMLPRPDAVNPTGLSRA